MRRVPDTPSSGSVDADLDQAQTSTYVDKATETTELSSSLSSAGHPKPNPAPIEANYIQALKAAYGPREALEILASRISIPDLYTANGTSTSACLPPGKLTKYPCFTQPPASIPMHPTKTRNQTIAKSIYGTCIPRWNPKSKQAILYACNPNHNWASEEDYNNAHQALHAAAEEWNKCNLGVRFASTHLLRYAAFELRPGPQLDNHLAASFFPRPIIPLCSEGQAQAQGKVERGSNSNISYLYIFPEAFTADNKPYMENVFMHELGHILGLCHEVVLSDVLDLESVRRFILSKEAEKVVRGALGDNFIRYSARAGDSVMGCEFPPVMSAVDRKTTEEFYRLPGTAELEEGDVERARGGGALRIYDLRGFK
ncbi:hypothetical protein BJY04DRAFT_220607 [Aspergillus karnatakaensis]|uniref:uncharacterized protein n=1 Tax=Aspergillus karnatakaensis TaxID=1810916 RepID=UPI003CCCD055